MSYIRINITDKNQTISGEVRGATGEFLVAALCAEPETIDELTAALERFQKRESDWSPFRSFRQYKNLEPYDAGILVIDLAGRTIAVDSSYAPVSGSGDVRVSSDFVDEDLSVPFRLSDDWLFVHSISEYEGICRRRREDRLKNPAFDARRILFGEPLVEFIARECAAAKDSGDEEIFTEIHAKWLMTAREDLRGKTPREILLEKRDFIDWDLHSRALQWSFTKVCPPALPLDSYAYLYAGFGTHETVVYYDLFRFLLEAGFENLRAGNSAPLDEEIERLSGLKNEWLDFPQPYFSGRKPAAIIEAERRRMNLTMSSHECLIDEDCPLCVAAAEDFDTPMFWHLDGCNMDDRFEFSFYKTLEEWESEQRRYAEFNREFDEGKWREREPSDFTGDF